MNRNQAPLLEAVFNHLVLPPKLPEEFDGDDVELCRNLGHRLMDACGRLDNKGEDWVWDAIYSSLNVAQNVNVGSLQENDLTWAFSLLLDDNAPEWLTFHVVKQNAALLVYRNSNTHIVFEAFQVAAPVATVLAADYALTWDFPGRAVTIPIEDFRSASFRDNLAYFLEQSSSESFNRFAARASKAGKQVVESRDCPSPALVSDMLMSLLEGLGDAIDVPRVRKRVRDDVLLGTSEIPWRRSPYWLTLRVALSRMLSDKLDDSDGGMGVGRVYYKFIMCTTLAKLLQDCVGKLHPEKTMRLLAKLCRRLAKLEKERSAASGTLRSTYDQFFGAASTMYKGVVTKARGQVVTAWDEYKKNSVRHIPRLPVRVPEKVTILTLTNSRRKLFRLLDQWRAIPAVQSRILALPSLGEGTVSQVNKLATRYAALVDHEAVVRASVARAENTKEGCIKFSMAIRESISRVGDAYKDHALLMSQHLLHLFELWVAMDQAAVEVCPALGVYHPLFVPQALDVLCLSTAADLKRLARVQRHLASRVAGHQLGRGHIFRNPSDTLTFPSYFLSSTAEGKLIFALGQKIDAASNASILSKTAELTRCSAEYDKLTESIGAHTCTCTRFPDGSRDIRGCTRCYKWRCRNRLEISVHEDFLPSSKDETHRAAILLELRMPQYLRHYREATWELAKLGWQVSSASGPTPELLVQDVEQLKPFWHPSTDRTQDRSLTLASVPKSFLQTHYHKLKLPAKSSKVLLPFAPVFSYRDKDPGLWATDLPEYPWFEHLLGPWLSKGLSDPYADAGKCVNARVFHPTSYEIAANEAKCPPDMSVHEFSALQRAVSGRGRRWLVLLVELAATNVNFSSEGTMALFNHLALQAGPSKHESEDNLREAHTPFRDQDFCSRLHEQLSARLDALAPSWREVHCMSIITTFALRLYHFCPSRFRDRAKSLLSKIRQITSDWINHLRIEIRSTADPDSARKAADYAFRAALLCRQTFHIYIPPSPSVGDWSDDTGDLEEELPPDGDDLRSFFRASIALQENLVVDVNELSPTLKRLLIHDLYSAHAMRYRIVDWVGKGRALLEDAINETWGDVGQGTATATRRSYSGWSFLSLSHAWWMASRVAGSRFMASQAVHYHPLQGHLLVDGKPLGRLPLEMTEDPGVKELFGRSHLLTRSSGMHGMEYQLVTGVEGHEVHFGFRDGRVLIRTRYRRSLFEFVPRDIFKPSPSLFSSSSSPGMADLPSGLIEDCVHWLNLYSGTLEMRRKPKIWAQRPANWVLNVWQRYATRNTDEKKPKQGLTPALKFRKPGTRLVEPRSEIGLRIASIFRGFEDTERLTIFWSAKNRRLRVELKQLEISFMVNSAGLLESGELGCTIDPNQDAGALYGLTSHIVVHSNKNEQRRSVLVPIGKFSWERRGMHVAVNISNDGNYARFAIDPLLGRLESPPDPELLYTKAALHALTSFPIPDRLTSRTGTEEARHCLEEAQSRPWTPLPDQAKKVLGVLQSLSPRRSFYPAKSKLYQKMLWDAGLTMTIQDESLAGLAGSILRQSQDLEVFQLTPDAQNNSPSHRQKESHDDDNDAFLNRRGLVRRRIYERVESYADLGALNDAKKTFLFIPQDRGKPSEESCRVYQAAKALRADSVFTSGAPVDLVPILQKWDTIGGFDQNAPPAKIAIQLFLDTELPLSWGSVVQVCRLGLGSSSTPSPDTVRFQIYFLLGILAFGKKANMEVISWLVALAKHESLQSVEPPQYSLFARFSPHETPDTATLQRIILDHQPDYKSYRTRHAAQARMARPLNAAQYKFRCVSEAKMIAHHCRSLWPDVPESFERLHVLLGEEGKEIHTQSKAWHFVKQELERCAHNNELYSYLKTLKAASLVIFSSQSMASDSQIKAPKHENASILKPQAPPPTAELQQSPSGTDPYQVPQLVTSGLLSKAYTGPHISSLPSREITNNTGHAINVWSGATQQSLGANQVNQLPHGVHAAPLAALPRFPELEALGGLIDGFVNSPNATRQQYGEDLRGSLAALVRDRNTPQPIETRPHINNVTLEIGFARKCLADFTDDLWDALSHDEVEFQWLSIGNLWPCLSPVTLLEKLRDDMQQHLGSRMREALVCYGLLVARLQRLLRIMDALSWQDSGRFQEELRHQGHSNWNPFDHPEWLLLEVDNNILIRPSQVDVARAIISPPSASNSVLQMNMGQGKTSCIMPMAVTELADKTRLCRLIVPRALLLQTAQVIQSRIGRLVGRGVRNIPFSRRSPTTAEVLDTYRAVHQSTLDRGDVMLCLPEHILSFKLSGLQKLADGHSATAKRMIYIQRWLNQASRDVLDESDFTLSCKTQLIYPSGPQSIVDGHPQRWQVVQELLLLVENHASSLQAKDPEGIEIVNREHGYPIIHLLHTEVEDALNDLLVADVCNGSLPQLQLKDLSLEASVVVKEHLRLIISGADVLAPIWAEVKQSLADESSGAKVLHLLRGLISQRIVILCLKKRWNVQYGLHPDRVPIAVPFEAKGVPSQTAEYGHPDTALILTCLAFYQTGLSPRQIAQGLQHVVRSDDPAAHYEHWVHGCDDLPPHLRHWNLVNADDEAQITELWAHLRFDRNVVNHYMNNFVFPAHAKQFGVKLQASGWDIPLLGRQPVSGRASPDIARTSPLKYPGPRLTTGFSGTNDNKRMLPLTIRQDDLPNLLQTNAEVLSYLLEPRNSFCHEAVDLESRKHLSERGLLEFLGKKNISILIDAGAHVLEMENHDLASAWLEIKNTAKAAAYFGSNSQIMVRARHHRGAVPLLASPFADNLEDCVVYIDEAHTRGTDLKLPLEAKGAVTLGLGQTKDQTVQAAMRLRKLGSTQSIAFVAPPEVYRSIMNLRPSGHRYPKEATSTDVVRWLLEQSCRANEHMMSLYVAQGFDFCRRTNALWTHGSRTLTDTREKDRLLDAVQQKEDQTLEQLYGGRKKPTISSPASSGSAIAASETPKIPLLQGYVHNLHQQKCALLSGSEGSVMHSYAFEEVEQEREVEFEVEQVREKQTMSKLVPLSFPGLDRKILQFVMTGSIQQGQGETSFVQAFAFLGRTKIGKKFGVCKTASRLFVSGEFCKTVAKESPKTNQDIVRPVEWILWSPADETAVIVIPEEAELVLPILRSWYSVNTSIGLSPRVWLLSYAAPVTKSMRVFNSLGYLTVPTFNKRQLIFPDWLPIEIGAVAGRLYFGYDEYKPLLSWLGVRSRDGGHLDSSPTQSKASGLPIKRPLEFLMEWLAYRRQTHDVSHTPMGFVCQRRVLRRDHPFFAFVKEEAQDIYQNGVSAGGIRPSKSDEESDLDSDDDDDDEWGNQEETDVETDGYNESLEDSKESSSNSKGDDDDDDNGERGSSEETDTNTDGDYESLGVDDVD